MTLQIDKVIIGREKTSRPFPLQITLTFATNQLQGITLSKSKVPSILFEGDCNKKKEILKWFDSYFEGAILPFPLELPLSHLGPFTQKVLKEMQKIPFGTTVSYGELAEAVGNPKAARAVGNACNSNPYLLVIPCHRVIQKDKTLGGFGAGIDIKELLLDFED